MKIIHLSDLHIGYPSCKERFDKIIENIILFCKNPELYIIIITGDIVDKGKKIEQLQTAKKQIDNFQHNGFKVLIVPGNHDYGSGIFPQKKYGERFNDFFYGVKNIDYPILGDPGKSELIDDIAFIGIDSMEEEVDSRDYMYGAEGRIGQRQLERLNEILSRDIVKRCRARVVYLHHHPFKQRTSHGLHDLESFKNILTSHGNVDCLLFGHNHDGFKWNGSWGIKRCYDAGTTTTKKGQPGHHRIIDLRLDPVYDIDGDFHAPHIAENDSIYKYINYLTATKL